MSTVAVPKIDGDAFKLILTLAIVIIVIVALKKGFAVIGQFLGMTDPTKADAGKAELASIKIDSKRLNYAPEKYMMLANKLYDAMKGWGTNDQAILDVFTLTRNLDDVKAVIKAFGVRDSMNLGQYLRDELGETRLTAFGLSIQELNKYLAERKVNYAF